MALRGGVDHVLRWSGGKRLLNVMYHGVVRKDSTWFSPRHVTEEAFRQQLAYLKRNFNVVSIAEAFQMRTERQRLKGHTVTISFDDGYLNNLEVALPIIEEFALPVTIFTLGPCAEAGGDRVLWPDRIALLRDQRDVHLETTGSNYDLFIERSRGSHLFDDLKSAMPDVRDAALRELVERYRLEEKLEGLDPHIWKLMGPQQLRALAGSRCIEIGSHGYAHYNLGLVPLEIAEKDMKNSKSALERLLGHSVESIAYPDGSYSSAVKDAAERIGFKRQLAVDYRCAEDPSDLRIQPRHGVPATTSTASAMLFLNRAFASRGVI